MKIGGRCAVCSVQKEVGYDRALPTAVGQAFLLSDDRSCIMKFPKAYVIALVFGAWVLMMGVTALVVLRLFSFNYNTIPQDGMYPSMPAGSHFFTRRNPYDNIHDVKRGDVVVFTRETNNGTVKFIWRVVGLPSDFVEISNEAVSLNGTPLKHETLRKEGQYLIVREWNGEVSYEVAYSQTLDRMEPPPVPAMKVPEDHLFLLGDNRYMAEDSTFIGPVPFSSVVEKKIF